MSETVIIPAGTQLDETHIALQDVEFFVERHGDVYSARCVRFGPYGRPGEALSADDAVWLAQRDLCELFDWVCSGDEDSAWARRVYGEALRDTIGHYDGVPSETAKDCVVLEGHLLEAGDGYEWSSLFISGIGLSGALAAAFRVEQMEDSYIQLWGQDEDGNDIDPDTTIRHAVDEKERHKYEHLFYDFGKVRITVERLGDEA